jgi:hypothetical protein
MRLPYTCSVFMSALLIKALYFAVMNVFHTVGLVLVTI